MFTKTSDMFLLDLFEAKAAFLAMVVILFIIPVWISIVAFTKKKGKADSVEAIEEQNAESEETI